MPALPSAFRKPAFAARALLGALVLVEAGAAIFGPSAKAAKEILAHAREGGDLVTHWEPYADIGIHWAAVLNLGLFAVLALTAGWWTRPFDGEVDSDAPGRTARPWWRRLAPVLAVMAFATLYGATSFGTKSLWWDEMWAVKQCSLGTWKPDKKNPEEVKFQPTTWKKCAFYYQKPTNHSSMSVLQKACLTVWQKLAHKKPYEFEEWVIRLPALIASGIAIVLLFRLCGLTGGVPAMAALLYLHPMHLHYGVDARAYTLIVPLCLSAILAERRIIFDRGRHLWPWAWLALNQAVWIWTYPTAVLDVLVLFLVLGVFLWRGEYSLRDRITALLRLVVAHTFAAALWLQLFLPNLIQMLNWAGKEDQGHELSADVFQDTVSQLAFGMNWHSFGSSLEARGLTSMLDMAGSPWAAGALIAMFFALAFTGIAWALRHKPKTGWLIAAPILSSVAYAAVGSLFGIYFYPRFVIAALPALIAGLSLCPTVFSDWAQKRRLIAYALLAVYLLPTMHQRGLIMSRPHSTGRDAVQYVRQWIAGHPSAKEPLVACYGLGREVMSVYYPKVLSANSPGDITALEDKARAEHRPLLMIQGYSIFNRVRSPEGMKLLDDRNRFAELGAWSALDPDFYYRVLEDQTVLKP